MGSMHTGLEGNSIPGIGLWYLGEERHDLTAMAEYFRERAQGGTGLMVTGGIAPNWQGWVAPFAAKLTTREEMEMHKAVTQAVHDVAVPLGYSSTETVTPKICLQILHAGRYAYHPGAVSASATRSPISPFKARALSTKEVKDTVHDFVRCARFAREAGYDGVEVMGSEGYLISQFMCPRTNKRTDEYGGKFENRSRFPLEIVRDTRKALGDDFIIIFRLSLLDLVEGGLTWNECLEMAKAIEDAGASIINTGIGWHEARVPTISTSVPRAAFAKPTHLLKKADVVDIPIVATNRINDPQVAERLLREDCADMVSMARPFLADPDFMKKARDGVPEEINTCIACNQACLDHAFVGKTASCLVNPRACHETEIHIHKLPTDHCLNIGVIGSGPAGCAFAITAAQMGHTVTLFERANDIGGQFNMAKRIPGKEEFHETLRYFRTMLKKHNVAVKLETDVSLDEMKQNEEVDKWIVATGVYPRDPKIPGEDHPNVLSYIDVLRNNAPVGDKVAIIGAGGIGFDVSEYLLFYDGHDKMADDVDLNAFYNEWGVDPTNQEEGGLRPANGHAPNRELVLLQRKKKKLGAGLGKTTGWIHRASLTNSNAVEMVGGAKYERIDEDGNLHIEVDGKKRVLDVDNIVICAGQVKKDDLAIEAKGTDLENKVYVVGGAFEAGELDAKKAIDMGTRLAVKIHDEHVIPGKHKFEAPMGAEEKLQQVLKQWM
jgi:2,4-dienoyl-CoA reductase (NADPH2)